ncbi:hypothetical protein ACE04B_05435 [Rhizobium phaseoli]
MTSKKARVSNQASGDITQLPHDMFFAAVETTRMPMIVTDPVGFPGSHRSLLPRFQQHERADRSGRYQSGGGEPLEVKPVCHYLILRFAAWITPECRQRMQAVASWRRFGRGKGSGALRKAGIRHRFKDYNPMILLDSFRATEPKAKFSFVTATPISRPGGR